MARVKSAKAAKDYPDHGIKKGDTYWFWTPYRQKRQISATFPSASQTESHETKAWCYGVDENLRKDAAAAPNREALKELVTIAYDELQEVFDQFEEKADSLEEGFGHETQQSADLHDWAEQVESWRNDLDNFRDEIPDEEDSEFDLEGAVSSIPEAPSF